MTSPIVALGASAGGLEALFELFSALPPSTGAAYVVIQHLDRDHKSLLTELLAKRTSMPVTEIEDGAAVEANHVFVIPPNRCLTVSENRFHLAPRDRAKSPHHPVDVFFESLAQERAGSAIGVVLSGGDSDGALGVKAIKDAGGITFAQQPESTKFTGMPQNAIDTGCVDFVMRPKEIAGEIVRLTRHPYMLDTRNAPLDQEEVSTPKAETDELALKRVFRRLRSAHGVDFSHYKRSTLRRRLSRRMALGRIEEMGAYVDALEEDTAETLALYQDFLIRVTGFFRDAELFEGLREQVFPAICAAPESNAQIRIWIAGCATGEEVYSIAIELLEYLGDPVSVPRIQIFGTDVSETAIEIARAGIYPDNIASEVSSERLARYFVRVNGRYHVAKRLRELCVFARHDVTRDPPFSRIDLLSCRNLLIYLDAAMQRRVMRAFHYALSANGFLALGLAESVGGASDMFDLLDKRHRIYSRRALASVTALVPADRGQKISPQSQSVEPEIHMAGSDSDSVLRESDRLLLGRYAPPSLLVDDALNILQFRGETGRYIEHASGPSSMNLHRVVRPQLLVEISPAIQAARDSGDPVWRNGLSFDELGDIALGVIPLRNAGAERCFLILFEAGSESAARRVEAPVTPVLSESEKDRRIAQLERELASTRGFLQTTMEEQESAREDLKSAHEEVLSANEEFQSTNEELETAKEELQSANEELTTTNDELLNRNRELFGLNVELQKTREITLRAQSYADAIVASVRDPLLVLDKELRILRANDAFYEDFGLMRNETEGKPLRDLDAQQWDIPQLLAKLEGVLAHNAAVVDQEISFRSSVDAAPRTLRVDARKIPGDIERAELILLAIEDVTERRAHADSLELAGRRKDEFLAMLAHELRNPLTPIRHAVHLLQQDDVDSREELYGMIDRQSLRLTRLVDDLLDLARINRGHIELRSKAVDLGSVVQDAADAAGARIEERGHEISLSLPQAPVFVTGDPVRLEQIVANLLENAVKYTDAGGRIDVKLTRDRGQAVLSVRDNGIGLAPENLQHVFDLFNQVDGSLARSGGGLGIGLTLVRRVLALHDGTIEARSAGVGHGAEFIVKLPILTLVPDAVSDVATDSTPQVGTPRRVLFVDDNIDVVGSLQRLAGYWGHEVAVANGGAEAIELVETFRPDTVVIDIGLPVMDGYEVARRLRARHPDLFLIALTGYGRDRDRAAATEAGFDAHLVKPADLDELKAMLSKGRG